MTVELGRLSAVDPRAVWPHEAHDFTPWLLANADALAEALGIDVELSAAEHPVCGFALDLFGRDLTNSCVLIVENQLAATDHSHLGQLLTYAAGTDARTIVWIAPPFREEHRQALDYLNDLGGQDTRFFGVEVAVVQIGDSQRAPLFRLRAQPNDWHAQIAAVAKTTSQQAGRAPLYREFWGRFLDRVRDLHPGWTNTHKPPTTNWLSMPSPLKGGAFYSVGFAAARRLRTELYIDSGDGDANTNANAFAQLAAAKARVEATYGRPLSWEDLTDRRACRIADYRDEGDITDANSWDDYIDWFLDSMARLRPALEKALSAPAVGSPQAAPSMGPP